MVLPGLRRSAERRHFVVPFPSVVSSTGGTRSAGEAHPAGRSSAGVVPGDGFPGVSCGVPVGAVPGVGFPGVSCGVPAGAVPGDGFPGVSCGVPETVPGAVTGVPAGAVAGADAGSTGWAAGGPGLVIGAESRDAADAPAAPTAPAAADVVPTPFTPGAERSVAVRSVVVRSGAPVAGPLAAGGDWWRGAGAEGTPS